MFRRRHSMEHCALFIITAVFGASNGLFIDYTENTELIQQRAGYDIKLHCGLKGLVDEDKVHDIKIHWYFKQCISEGVSGTSNCHDLYENDWTQLPCEESFCKTDLLLRNVTDKYSGLYKCTVYPLDVGHKLLDIQLVRTYQLDVKNTSLTVPEFLDTYPLNKTAEVGAQVVFQCRVHSEIHPTTIKWFRRVPQKLGGTFSGNENFNAHIVHYNGRTYELLSTAREKIISDEIYLSKLILNGVHLHDEGYYACVAISYRGYRIREAYLQVYLADEVEYWMDYESDVEGRTNPREFWLLFLMPLSLAMLPLIVWLGYVIYKSCRRRAEVNGGKRQYSKEDTVVEQCILRT